MYDSDETLEGTRPLDPSQTPTLQNEETKEGTESTIDTRGAGGETTEATATDGFDPAPDPEAPAQSPDPDPEAFAAGKEPASELERLRGELNRLRRDMEAQKRAFDRFGAECAEFCELYPEKSPSEIPDDVWASMREGVPLAAAFALHERRRTRIEEAARLLNEKNRSRSTGAVETSRGGYLSPDEVRAMTPAEVKANYQSILLSMQKWR